MPPYYTEPGLQLLNVHALEGLRSLPDASVHCCITSPPYYGLRAYPVEPQIWDAVDGCEHVWGKEQVRAETNKNVGFGERQAAKGERWAATNHTEIEQRVAISQGAFCQVCPAWRGSLGNEPTPGLFIAHLVQIFAEVKRVLHPSGTCWVVVGDSFASSPKKGGSGTYNGRNGHGEGYGRPLRDQGTGLSIPPKNLCLIPQRLAIALQEAGWWVRSTPPWLKRNSMPESTTDRPGVSHETVLLLAKRETYFWDIEAVRIPHRMKPQRRPDGRPLDDTPRPNGQPKQAWPTATRQDLGVDGHPNGRNRRTADWWFESLDAVISDTEAWLVHAQQVRAHGGMLLDPDGEPLGFNVNPQPTTDKHYAGFGSKLITPMLLASTSQRGCCGECGEPWVRVTTRPQAPTVEGSSLDRYGNGKHGVHRKVGQAYQNWLDANPTNTLGWCPTCAHYPETDQWEELPRQEKGEPDAVYQARCAPIHARREGLLRLWEPMPSVPCTVLDPFVGRGTTLVTARRLGRHSYGIDLSADYCAMTKQSLGQTPLFDEPIEPVGVDPQQSFALEEPA